MKQRILILSLLAALMVSLAIPAAAQLFTQDAAEPSVAAFSKNGTAAAPISFTAGDFVVSGDGELSSLVVQSLPDARAGLLKLGSSELHTGDSVAVNALSGLRFHPLAVPTVSTTQATFLPVFSDGLIGEAVTVSLYVLAKENAAPIAENLEIATYQEVAVTGQFAAVDPDGDLVTFRLMTKPARGKVEISEDGSGSFVYTPYEKKKGKDSFTYVAVDSVGNISEEATVKVTISKAKTKVTYADMDGHSSYCSALRLAEEGVLIGTQVDGAYYFQPELPVSRDQFVAMAMSAAGLESLNGIGVTGFSDDEAIPTWAKGYVSSALRSGILTGMRDDRGGVCFNTGATVTGAEATVILDRILNVSDVPVLDVLAEESIPTWASQSAANMSAVNVLDQYDAMSEGLSRAQAAEMLCGMLDVLETRANGWS